MDTPLSDQPVRLLVVNPSPVRGGAESSLMEFLTRCDRTRVEPIVACLADGPYVDDLEAAGVAVRRLRAGRLRDALSWARTVAALRRLARAADVVLSWQVKGHYYGTPAARLARRPVAWWDHGIRPARGEARYAIDNRLPAGVPADVVVTSSAASAARHKRARVILPGIPLPAPGSSDPDAARALLDLPAADVVVGTVGRLQPWKGQHLLLRAAAVALKQIPTLRVVIVGGTPGGFSQGYPAELARLAASLGIADRVLFTGERADVPQILPAFDLFVLPSYAEPFGLVSVEAMAAGVPVVATSAGGVPEIITDGIDGRLVPVDDHQAMADAIVEVLGDPEGRAAMARAGEARARSAFDIQRYVTEIEDLTWELAGR